MKLKKNGEPYKIRVRKPMKQSTKDKIAKGLRGNKNTSGSSLTQEHKQKISDALIDRDISDLTKSNMSLAQKRIWNGNEERRLAHKIRMSNNITLFWNSLSDDQFGEFIKSRREVHGFSGTKPENIFENLLISEGLTEHIDYEKQKRIGKFPVDFLLSERKIVEIQGCYYHGCEQCNFNSDWQIKRRNFDLERKKYLESMGYQVQFVWEHQLYSLIEKNSADAE